MSSSSPVPTGLPAPEGRLSSDTLGAGPRLVMAHGFTQTGRVWGGMDRDLASDHQVVRVDMPGHGDSSGVAATLPDGALKLADAGGRAVYLGYSMGARFCLHVALARPESVEGLVLVSGTAGIDDPTERRRRRESDQALADEIDPHDGRPALPVATFLRRWLDNPLFAGISAEANGLAERLRNTGPGLASSLRLAGTGTQRPLWTSLAALVMPVVVISGELDEKFCTLGRRLAASIGDNATHAVVPGAGHAPHLQYPDHVAALVRSHLAG